MSSMHRMAPGPRGMPLFGNLFQVLAQGQLRQHIENWRRFGDVVRTQMGRVPVHLIVRPDHVRQVLIEKPDQYVRGRSFDKLRPLFGNGILMSEGDRWQRQRRELQPSFTRQAVSRYVPIMTGTIDERMGAWDRGHHSDVDLLNELSWITMHVLARAILGVPMISEATELGRRLAHNLRYGIEHSGNPFAPPLWVPTRENRRFRHYRKVIDLFVRDLIGQAAGRAEGLIATRLRDVSHAELTDEILSLFVAGFETTTVTLLWAFSYLSTHPDVQRKVRDEVDQVLGDRVPEADDVSRLAYIRQVIRETLRLRPPVSLTARDALADDVIGGFHVPRGSIVVISPYLTHRHPDFWTNPEGFDPERFDVASDGDRNPCSYLPFLVGPHTCLGLYFAMVEAALVLAMIVRRYEVFLNPASDLEPHEAGTLRPRTDVRFMLRSRQLVPYGARNQTTHKQPPGRQGIP